MENKQSPSKKKLISIQEEKLIREVDYDSPADSSNRFHKKPFVLDLEILQKNSTRRQASQRVLVSIKPRAPAIKTLYIAEKSRFHSKKGSDKSGSRLAIGDHSSFTTHFSEDVPNVTLPHATECETEERSTESEITAKSSVITQVESISTVSKCSQSDVLSKQFKLYKEQSRSAEKCYVYTQPQLTMNLPKINAKIEKPNSIPNKVDISTLIITNTSSEDSLRPSVSLINKLHKRLDHLERKVLRQEMVFRSIDPNIPLSSSDEESKDNIMRSTSETARPGCSYIQQYSHIPETSAFQRYAQQAAPLSPSKTTTLEKEHNSEQYGRDFTAYDGITARGRRQCASVPCKRDDIPKLAAERVHKIRHKLNPVRDYRLMDTVHYLAQGEFAPRDDGIKLTPSREAVLSDIIWEDVCRTHWPNTRLSRRTHPERCGTRFELQRLIDSLLRERVAHVERRRRRHYRIVKLNHRHENCRPNVGKTGDIIVASHKDRPETEEREVASSDYNTTSAMMAERRREETNQHKGHKSHDRLMFPEIRHKHHFRQEECTPGPSYIATRSPGNREPTCCYHASGSGKPENCKNDASKSEPRRDSMTQELTSSSASTCKNHSNNPRLLIKKDSSRRRYYAKEEPNLEHFILLPTLVVRTPSNVRRQKKFNELYRRILNVQVTNEHNNCAVGSEAVEKNSVQNPNKKDIGFNINITLSNSVENIHQRNE